MRLSFNYLLHIWLLTVFTYIIVKTFVLSYKSFRMQIENKILLQNVSL